MRESLGRQVKIVREIKRCGKSLTLMKSHSCPRCVTYKWISMLLARYVRWIGEFNVSFRPLHTHTHLFWDLTWKDKQPGQEHFATMTIYWPSWNLHLAYVHCAQRIKFHRVRVKLYLVWVCVLYLNDTIIVFGIKQFMAMNACIESQSR